MDTSELAESSPAAKPSKPDLNTETKALAKNLANQGVTTQKMNSQKVDSQHGDVTIQESGQTSGQATGQKAEQLTNQTPAATSQAPVKINDEAQIWKIPIDRLVANTQQPRQIFTPDALRDLTASIKEQGILQPITARRLGEREFEIIAGERRWRAAQAAGLHEVPVILKNVSQQVSLELAIIENIQREDLNPMDEAEAIEHLATTYKLTQQQVAEKLGKDRSSVANSLRLLSLPKELREFVRTTELSAGHAKVLLGIENIVTQVKLAKQIVSDKLSVRATEKLVAKAKSDAREDEDGAKSDAKSETTKVPQRLIENLANELQKLLGTKVAIDYAGGKGRLNVHFYTDDQLTSIVEKMRKSWQK